MIDLKKITYEVYVVTGSGGASSQMDITAAVEDVSWQEMDKQLACKITFKMYNAMYSGRRLSQIVGLGQGVQVVSRWSGGKEVVAGIIFECERNTALTQETFNVVAYGRLYYLQKSQDNFWFEEGNSTAGIISSACGKWGVAVSYKGPNAVHPKILKKNAYIADFCLEMLKAAEKLGAGEGVFREVNGRIEVVKVGSNPIVYAFTEDNSISAKQKYSIADMVTQVQVVTSKNEDQLPQVLATVTGSTKYGVFQRIITATDADNLGDAQSEANDLIKEKGKPAETCTAVLPDTPPVHKGDKIYIEAGALNGYYIVLSVQHNCATMQMNVTVKKV